MGVLGQLNVIFAANSRRWKKSCDIFAEQHIKSLEKMCESWKDLEYAILLSKDERYQRLAGIEKKRIEPKRLVKKRSSNPLESKEDDKEQKEQQAVAPQDDIV